MGSKTSSATPRELKVVENDHAAVKGEVRDHLTAVATTVIPELDTVVDLNGLGFKSLM